MNSKVKTLTAGQEIAASLREAIAWAEGGEVAVNVTRVEVPVIDVGGVATQAADE